MKKVLVMSVALALAPAAQAWQLPPPKKDKNGKEEPWTTDNVTPEILAKAKPYLAQIEKHYPWYYGKEVRWAISAYALYTRKQMGDLDIAKGQKLFAEYGGTKGATVGMETLAPAPREPSAITDAFSSP